MVYFGEGWEEHGGYRCGEEGDEDDEVLGYGEVTDEGVVGDTVVQEKVVILY